MRADLAGSGAGKLPGGGEAEPRHRLNMVGIELVGPAPGCPTGAHRSRTANEGATPAGNPWS
jgi:hypothetical protein